MMPLQGAPTSTLRLYLMQNINFQLFNFFNASANLHGLPLLLAIIVAKYLVFLVPLWLVVCWLWGARRYRSTLLFATLAAILALCLSKIIGFLWYTPRPFVLGMGHTFLNHAADSSFPSDHVTFIWAIGLCVVLKAGLRGMGVLLLILALCVGWARVFLGIHFPFDILGGIITASIAVLLLSCIRPWIDHKILPRVESIYRKIFAKAIANKSVQG